MVLATVEGASTLPGLQHCPAWAQAKGVLERVDPPKHSDAVVVQRGSSASKLWVLRLGPCSIGIEVPSKGWILGCTVWGGRVGSSSKL